MYPLPVRELFDFRKGFLPTACRYHHFFCQAIDMVRRRQETRRARGLATALNAGLQRRPRADSEIVSPIQDPANATLFANDERT